MLPDGISIASSTGKPILQKFTVRITNIVGDAEVVRCIQSPEAHRLRLSFVYFR
jgi:hypothetical protein